MHSFFLNKFLIKYWNILLSGKGFIEKEIKLFAGNFLFE